MAFQFRRRQSHTEHVRNTRHQWFWNLFCLWIVLLYYGCLHVVLCAGDQWCVLLVGLAALHADFYLGLSLEDMNELFSQDSLRDKFVPSRMAEMQAQQDVKRDDHPDVQHVDYVSSRV